MKNRDYKQFAPDSTHHIFNRGVAKMDIFLDDDDFLFFLKRMKEAVFPVDPQNKQNQQGASLYPRRKQLPPNAFDILLYALMPNHFHFVIQQLTDLPISALISKVCTSYSMYFNKKYKRVGALFQDQFKAVVVESNEQLLYLAAYIHNNPLKAGLVSDLRKYPYSSHLDYLGIRNGTLCKKELILGQFKTVKDYSDAVIINDSSMLSDEMKIDSYGDEK